MSVDERVLIFGFLLTFDEEDIDNPTVYDAAMNRDAEAGVLGPRDNYASVGDGFWGCLKTGSSLAALRVTEGGAILTWLPLDNLSKQVEADFRLCAHFNAKSRGFRYRVNPCAEITVVDTRTKEEVWCNTNDEEEETTEPDEDRLQALPYEWRLADEWNWPEVSSCGNLEERPDTSIFQP